jgi:FKBP-type peptidyl-prolyl cis-trans isomerase 2
MKKELLAAIILAVIILGALLAYFYLPFGESIEAGDCAEVHYIGRYASNNTVFDTSYENVENKTGGTPLKTFITLDTLATQPEGYESYVIGIEGFAEGLIGLKKDESATIGPIPPEKAYGVLPQIGDTIDISAELMGQDTHLIFIDIIENAPIPEEYAGILFGNTTLYVLKDRSYYVGQLVTLYQSWENATTITKINDTMIWLETNPPADKITNFTWMELDLYGGVISYWEDASSATMNDTHIVVTHNPVIGDSFQMDSGYYILEYTVVNFTEDMINVSYEDPSDGSTIYTEIARTQTIERNQTQNITYSWPTDVMDYILNVLRGIDSSVEYSVGFLAGESLVFEVEIVEVYKTSQN